MRAAKLNRQFARFDVDVEVHLTICDSSAEQVVPINGGRLSGRMTNISGGGSYIVFPMFLPRETLVVLEVPEIDDMPAGMVRARVVMVRMIDRDPSYGVGLRFEDDDSPVVQFLHMHLSQETPT